MQPISNITDCYNKTASKYAQKFSDELAAKIFDNAYLTTFAQRNGNKGQILDLGCGPGHATQFLKLAGCSNVIGLDLAPGMIAVAKQLYPDVRFEVGNMLQLRFSDKSIHGAIALYSIIHFDYETIPKAFAEIARVLAPKSEFLLSFHIGEEVIIRREFLEETVIFIIGFVLFTLPVFLA